MHAVGQRHFAEAARSSDVVTHGWDKHWWLTIMSEGGLSVTPAGNVVSQRGFGPDATHGVSEAAATTRPSRWGSRCGTRPGVALDVDVERELELHLNRVGGTGGDVGAQGHPLP